MFKGEKEHASGYVRISPETELNSQFKQRKGGVQIPMGVVPFRLLI